MDTLQCARQRLQSGCLMIKTNRRGQPNRWIAVLAGVGVMLVLGSLWLRHVEALVWSMFAMRRCTSCETKIPAPAGDG